MQIARQLLQRQGETPEALRDVSVSLNNIGRTYQTVGEWETAREHFQAALELGERLAEAFPDLPEYNQLPNQFRVRLKTLETAANESQTAS